MPSLSANPAFDGKPVNDPVKHPETSIDKHELLRLRECERAWQAVFFALQAGNRDTFQGPGNGRECAVREIQRLQRAAAASFVVSLGVKA